MGGGGQTVKNSKIEYSIEAPFLLINIAIYIMQSVSLS